jgi:hypothetical protein
MLLSELRDFVYPLDGAMWKCGPITNDEIWAAVNANITEDRSWNTVVNILDLDASRDFHIRRVATLVNNPINEPITLIVVNHTEEISAYLNDGNHRLAAAYVRGDRVIVVRVAASNPAGLMELFPQSILES